MEQEGLQDPAESIIKLIREAQAASSDPEDPSMKLTAEELSRALEVKAAIEADERIANLTDFEVVHYTMGTMGERLEKVCDRVFKMQCFKELYSIEDTAEEGVRIVDQMTLDIPEMMLAIEYLPASDNYILVADYAAYVPSNLNTDDKLRANFGGNFYFWQALTPDFRTMRQGVSLMTECSGATMANADFGLMERFAVEFAAHYPLKLREQFLVNAETIICTAYALWKRFLPKKYQKQIHMGYQIPGLDGQRLDILYKQPTAEAARERLLLKVLELLSLRYHNQAKFRLDNVKTMDAEPTPTPDD